jgi:Ca2+-binding EF-hand superfamily protein
MRRTVFNNKQQTSIITNMKRILTALTILTLGVAFTAPAQAGKGGKKGDKKAIAAILATYDKNGNGKIDGDEVTALRADFAAGKPELKVLDTNGDGTLSDEEIAAIGAKKKKKNKAAQ